MNKFLIIALGMLMQASPTTIVVPVQNPSFEQFSNLYLSGYQGCGAQGYAQVPGWTGSGGAVWILQSIGEQPVPEPGTCQSSAPDGKTVATAGWGSTITQDLGPAFNVDGIYTVKFYTAAFNYWYAGAYTVSLNVGQLQLCSISGLSMGDFQPVTLTCPNQRVYPGELTLTLTGSGNFMVMFDDVSITFTPVS